MVKPDFGLEVRPVIILANYIVTETGKIHFLLPNNYDLFISEALLLSDF